MGTDPGARVRDRGPVHGVKCELRSVLQLPQSVDTYVYDGTFPARETRRRAAYLVCGLSRSAWFATEQSFDQLYGYDENGYSGGQAIEQRKTRI